VPDAGQNEVCALPAIHKGKLFQMNLIWGYIGFKRKKVERLDNNGNTVIFMLF